MTDYELDTPTAGANRHAKATRCGTCDGDRFVTVRLRSPDQTIWMTEHRIQANPREFHDEVAPCPDCNNIDVGYFRHDGSKFRPLDPADVREALRP